MAFGAALLAAIILPLVTLPLVILSAGAQPVATAMAALPVVKPQVVRVFPHDPQAFTEGLFIDHGELFESTGEVGHSSVRKVDLVSGKVLEKVDIPSPMFGEGIAPWQDQIISLTWRSGIGFRWRRKGLRPISHFAYMGEGWALTRMGEDLVMSDGTNNLRILDPATFRLKRLLPITAEGSPVYELNELEYVNGEILANIFTSDLIARINPESGHVIGWIDLADIHRRAGVFGPEQVANGIAWDAIHHRLYVTGKQWPMMFEIRLPKIK